MKTRLILLVLLVLLAVILAVRFLSPSGLNDKSGAEPNVTAVSQMPTADSTPMPTPESSPEPTPEQTPEPTPESSPEPTLEPTPEPTPYRPDVDISSWEFILANPTHTIENYAPELTELEGGQQFDSRAVDALKEFIAAARAEGLSVYLSSSYRSFEMQDYLYRRKVAQYGGNEAVAATIVAPPGTSEHQTGLGCDITDRYYESKDRSLENTELFKWMNRHCAEYGFILRYPDNKQDITGIIYEPWHFRYVGKEAASFIMSEGICLEEFLQLYE